MEGGRDSPYFKVDHFFTVDKLMADWLNQNTETKGSFLPASIFSKQCYIADYASEFASEVVFMGSKGYHREWDYRPRLIDWISQSYGSRFAHQFPGVIYSLNLAAELKLSARVNSRETRHHKLSSRTSGTEAPPFMSGSIRGFQP